MGRVVFVLCCGSMATSQRPQSKRICIVSLQHFGGRSRDRRWGAGCTGTRRTGPRGHSHLALAPHPDPGVPWVLLDSGSESEGVLGATGPVSPSFHVSHTNLALLCPLPGQALAASFVLLPYTRCCGHPLHFHSEGPRSPGTGLAGQEPQEAAGIALPAAGSCLHPAPCLPPLLQRCQTRVSPSPSRNKVWLSLGCIACLSSLGSSVLGAAGEGP